MKMTIPRLYSGADGKSHWGDVEFDMTSVTSLKATTEKSTPENAQRISFRIAPADCFQDFHPAPCRQYVITLQGEAVFTTGDGDSRQFGPGGIFLAEDMTGQGHSSRGIGTIPRLSCYILLEDQKVTGTK